MGKKLIVTGADFSANGIIGVTITWLKNYTDMQLVGAQGTFQSTSTYCFAPEDVTEYSGSVIRYVKCYAAAAGTISIAECSVSGTTPTVSRSESHTVARGINLIKLNTPITLGSTKTIGFAGKSILTFNSTGGTGWRFHVAGQSSVTTGTIPIDFGIVEDV